MRQRNLLQQPADLRRLENIAVTLPQVLPGIDSGDLVPWLRLHELTGSKPDVLTLRGFAEQYLDDGHLDAALYAYELAGVHPDPDRLALYAQEFQVARPLDSARALYLSLALEERQLVTKVRRWYERFIGSRRD